MRKLILSMQVSLDGFIEGRDGDMSWMAFNSSFQNRCHQVLLSPGTG